MMKYTFSYFLSINKNQFSDCEIIKENKYVLEISYLRRSLINDFWQHIQIYWLGRCRGEQAISVLTHLFDTAVNQFTTFKVLSVIKASLWYRKKNVFPPIVFRIFLET